MFNTNQQPESSSDSARPAADVDGPNHYKDRYLTIPNVICVVRFLGSLVILWFAFNGNATVFTFGFIALSLSDTVDGRLARWLNQKSEFGARLDSASDATLYGCLAIGSVMLKWKELQPEAVWLIVPLVSYAVTTGYGLWKYGRIPSYHTWGAKYSQWLVLAGATAMLLDWSMWPMRVASVAVTLTNIEAIAITFVLPTWRADVLTLLHVLPKRPKTD
ncbi:MAG: CDP-alcohol phosphatidyltransferase family protein [Fuerstia sp.]|nr:CDP-alcohol phosphatidyltransferase family protein [Fuerstiella sp.]